MARGCLEREIAQVSEIVGYLLNRRALASQTPRPIACVAQKLLTLCAIHSLNTEMFPTLVLTSPNTSNKDVKLAQWLMAGHGRFGEKYYMGPLDSSYGPMTSTAAWSAKFWAGYPLSLCNHVFGPTIYSYLLPLTHKDAKKLPLVNRIRRAYRLKHKPTPTAGQKALAFGQQFVGYREGPNNNDNIFGAFFGINHNPWCGCYVSYCYTKTGTKVFLPYVPNIVAWANSGQNNLHRVYTPLPGDLVCFDWDNNGVFDHVEFVESFDGTTIHTLGGNTLPPGGGGDPSNGGGVYKNQRSATISHVFVRVK